MKKLLLVLFILWTHSVMSTETRVNTLGGVPYFLIDNSNVCLYPALITNYPNEFIGEVKHPSISGFIDLGRLGIFGIGINNDSASSILTEAIKDADFTHFSSPPPQFAMYYGRKIRRLGAVGLKLNAANEFYEEAPSNSSQSIWILGSTIGLTYPLSRRSSIDFMAGTQRFGFKSKYLLGTGDSVIFKDQGKYSITGGVRALSLLSPTSLLIIGATYNKFDVSWLKGKVSEVLTLGTTEAYTGISLSASSKATIIFGLLVSKSEADTITGQTTFNTITYSVPKIVMGMETRLNDWSIVRIGANKDFNYRILKVITMPDSVEIKNEQVKETTFNLSFGFGFSLRDFELDIMCNELPFVTSSLGLAATYKFNSF
ncbi:MAG: hypothetical protein HY769_01295 [Candidatus Stahlbacteria bacterium]|nr:hypothetical protein [Candidatus Stahlbacteria bacterium]